MTGELAGRQVVLTHGDLAEENAATEAVYGGADAVVQSLERGRVMDEPGREKEGPRCDPTIDVEAPKVRAEQADEKDEITLVFVKYL